VVQVPLFMLCRSVVSGEVLDCLIDGCATVNDFGECFAHACRVFGADDVATEDDATRSGLHRIEAQLERIAWVWLGWAAQAEKRN